MVCPFARHVPMGKAVQFVVDGRNQTIECTLLAAAPGQQELRRGRSFGGNGSLSYANGVDLALAIARSSRVIRRVYRGHRRAETD
jgi:hypothetical protein